MYQNDWFAAAVVFVVEVDVGAVFLTDCDERHGGSPFVAVWMGDSERSELMAKNTT